MMDVATEVRCEAHSKMNVTLGPPRRRADVQNNGVRHCKWADCAANKNTRIIFFGEVSACSPADHTEQAPISLVTTGTIPCRV